MSVDDLIGTKGENDHRADHCRELLAGVHDGEVPLCLHTHRPNVVVDHVKALRLEGFSAISLNQLDPGDVLLNDDVQVGHLPLDQTKEGKNFGLLALEQINCWSNEQG